MFSLKKQIFFAYFPYKMSVGNVDKTKANWRLKDYFQKVNPLPWAGFRTIKWPKILIFSA
jgi:hypothetical protein